MQDTADNDQLVRALRALQASNLVLHIIMQVRSQHGTEICGRE